MKSHIYLLFPFLDTFESFEIEGVEFKGPFENGAQIVKNFEHEDEKDKYHIGRIVGSFRISEDEGLQGFTYSIQEVNSQEEYVALRKRVEIATNIVRYWAFDKNQRNSFSYPQTTLYIFELTEDEWKAKARKIGSSDREFIWYRGLRDFVQETNLSWPRGHIYPPAYRMSSGYLQIPDSYFLIPHLHKARWKSRGYKEEERLRIIRAIEHYNRSYAEGSGIDDRNRVLSLSAGFETLMSLPDERIQQAFRSAVITLLGDISNLGDWALDFYNLRSKIVHGEEIASSPRSNPSNKQKRKIASLYFKHSEGEYEYIKHLEIGQNIFRKCLETVISQRSLGYVHDIISLLEPNEVYIKRIEEGIKKLSDKLSVEEWYQKGILHAYHELKTKDWTAKSDKVVKIGKELLTLLKKYLQDNKISLDKEIDEILNFSGKLIDLAMLYHALSEQFSKIYFGDKTQRQKIEEYAIEGAAYNFISFASHVLFLFKGSI